MASRADLLQEAERAWRECQGRGSTLYYRTRRDRRADRNKEAIRKSCEGKSRHEIKDAAEQEATRLGLRFKAYRCGNCGGWHVGRG